MTVTMVLCLNKMIFFIHQNNDYQNSDWRIWKCKLRCEKVVVLVLEYAEKAKYFELSWSWHLSSISNTLLGSLWIIQIFGFFAYCEAKFHDPMHFHYSFRISLHNPNIWFFFYHLCIKEEHINREKYWAYAFRLAVYKHESNEAKKLKWYLCWKRAKQGRRRVLGS